MPSQWYYRRAGKLSGPFASKELKNLAATSQLRPDDEVWKEGMQKWVLASVVAGLFDAANDQPTSPTTTQPAHGAPTAESSPATQQVPAAANQGGLLGKVKSYLADAEKRGREELRKYKVQAAYVTGRWDIKQNTVGELSRDGEELVFNTGVFTKKRALAIPYRSIKNVSISTMDSIPRVTAGRVMFAGVLALAWKKQDRFIHIEFAKIKGVGSLFR